MFLLDFPVTLANGYFNPLGGAQEILLEEAGKEKETACFGHGIGNVYDREVEFSKVKRTLNRIHLWWKERKNVADHDVFKVTKEVCASVLFLGETNFLTMKPTAAME